MGKTIFVVAKHCEKLKQNELIVDILTLLLPGKLIAFYRS